MNKLLLFLFILMLSNVIYAGDTTVYVPMSSSYETKKDWTPPIDSILSAGDTITFKNTDSINVLVPYVALATDGDFVYKTISGRKDTLYLVAGGFHQIFFHKIYAECASLKVKVKLVTHTYKE